MNERKFEYIDREKAIKELTDWKWGLDATCVMQAIEYVPAEDVAPIVRGRWIRKPSEIGTIDVEKCSVCGCEMTERNQFWDAKTCPICSARMDGDSDA